MTTVVNINHTQYDTYIGRAGKGQNGYFGNPHPVAKSATDRPCPICHIRHDREGAIKAYERDFKRRLGKDAEFRQRVMALEGKRLGCFCHPHACHGDVIIRFLEWVKTDQGKCWLAKVSV